MSDNPKFDFSRGWAEGYCIALDDKQLLVNTVMATAATCKQRTEFLLQRDLPPNYKVVPIALVFRKGDAVEVGDVPKWEPQA